MILSFTQRDSESYCPLWLLSQHTDTTHVLSQHSERLNSSMCGGWADPGQEEVGEDFLRRGSGPRAQLSEPWRGGCSVRKQDSGCGLDLPVEALSLDLQAPELVLYEVSQCLPHLQLRRSEKEH